VLVIAKPGCHEDGGGPLGGLIRDGCSCTVQALRQIGEDLFFNEMGAVSPNLRHIAALVAQEFGLVGLLFFRRGLAPAAERRNGRWKCLRAFLRQIIDKQISLTHCPHSIFCGKINILEIVVLPGDST
jgi:hypothetical protein